MDNKQSINTEQVVGIAAGMQKQGEDLGNGVVEFLSKQTPPEEPFLGSKYSVIILVAVLFAARYAFNNPDKVKLIRDFIRDPKATLKAIQEKKAKADEEVDEQVTPAAPSKSTEFLNNTLSVFSLINKGQGSRFWLFLILAIVIVFASMAPVMLPIFTQLRK